MMKRMGGFGSQEACKKARKGKKGKQAAAGSRQGSGRRCRLPNLDPDGHAQIPRAGRATGLPGLR